MMRDGYPKEGTKMWVIYEISFLNTADNPNVFKPILHLTDNSGKSKHVQLSVSNKDIRNLTIQQLEDVANGLVDINSVVTTHA